MERLSGRVTWTAVGRMALALLPLAAALLVVGGLTVGAFHALGIGPLLAWGWGSFSAATVWWHKALIAILALAGAVGFGALVWWLGRCLRNEYGRW